MRQLSGRPVLARAGLRTGGREGGTLLERPSAHLTDPENISPPMLEKVTRYDLGALDGVRILLGFRAARGGAHPPLHLRRVPKGRSDRRLVLGVIDLDGSADWTELTDEDGGSFRCKIEGLSRGFRDARKVHFVIEDDETVPSEIFEATLSEGFFQSHSP